MINNKNYKKKKKIKKKIIREKNFILFIISSYAHFTLSFTLLHLERKAV